MEKYKRAIENMLNNKNIKDVEDTIRKFLKGDLDSNKITEYEYNELNKFLNQKIQENSEIITNKIKEDSGYEEKNKEAIEQRQIPIEHNAKEFYKRLQLKVEPIYKREIGKIEPNKSKKDVKER